MDTVIEVQDRLDNMVGLDSVKTKIDQLVNSALVQQRRKAEGKKVPKRDMNLLFAGNPGTGKTTVAQEIAPLYYALGLTENENFKAVTGDELKSEFKGGSAKKAKEVFNEAKGGVLFVDEAYALKSGQNDEYGDEAIAALLPLLEDPTTVVIFGGYEDDLKNLMKANAGLQSRFGETLTFDDYSPNERSQILSERLAQNDYTLDSGARSAIKEAVKHTGEGNARDVMQLMNQVLYAQEDRVALTHDDPNVITAEDVTRGADHYAHSARLDRRVQGLEV